MSIIKSSQVNPLLGTWPPQLSGVLRILSGAAFVQTRPASIRTAAEATPCPLAITASILTGQSHVICLRLIGELNYHSYSPLVESARSHYCEGRRTLLLDLSQTTAIELTGFFALLNIARLYSDEALLDPDEGWAAIRGPMREANPALGKYVKLLAPSPQLCTALDRTGFCPFLERYVDLESAMAALACQELPVEMF